MKRFRIIALAFSVITSFILNVNLLIAQESAINKGIAWVESTQNLEGYWGIEDEVQYNSFVNTCQVANTLEYLEATGTTYTNAIVWINSIEVTNIDYLCQQIEVLSWAEIDVLSLFGSLTAGTNEDGGWNIAEGFEISDVKRTALALKAFKSINFSDITKIQPALDFLVAKQNPDGGWGFTSESGNNVYLTSLVLLTLNQYRKEYYLEEAINKAQNWLISHQNSNGSFGTSIYETALSYSALIGSRKWGVGSSTGCLKYILDAQLDNGSWNNDAYTTALALRALKDSAPDLAVSWQEITFEPDVPTAGEMVTIKATIWNYGGTPVENVEVVIGNRLSVIGEIEVGGSATVSVTGTFTAGSHKVVVKVDPNNKIKERDETNNIASKNLTSAILADLTLSSADISFSPPKPTNKDIIRVNATIYNQGEVNVYSTVVSFYAGNPDDGGIELAQVTLTSQDQDGIIHQPILPAGGNVKVWVISNEPFQAGTYDIYVVADLQNTAQEINETNNIAHKTLIVTGRPTISTPKRLIAIPGNAIVDLSWNPNPEENLAGYNLYRNGSKINTESILNTTYRDTGLINGMNYTYTVTAVDTEGNESNRSAPVSVTPQDYYINPPTITSPTIAGTPIWINTTPITISGKTEPNTTVELFINEISFGTTIADNNGTFTFVGINLIEGTNTITAVAIKDGNRSQPALPIIVILDTTPPQAPTGLKATPGNKFIYLNWAANTESDLAGYNIYRDEAKINPTLVMYTLYWDIGLINGKEYTYKITALDRTGNESKKSIEVKVTPSEMLPEVKVGIVGHFYMEVANRLNSSELPIVGVTGQNYTYKHLKDYEVIVVTEHDCKITTQEIEAIKEYLDKGGAVFLAQDDIGREWWIHNIIFPLFGISGASDKHFTSLFTFKNSFFAQGVSNLESIADPDNERFELAGAQPLLIDKDGDVFICYQGHKTVLMGEGIYASWDTGGVLDASQGDWIQLFRNIIKWLLMKPDLTLSSSDISFSNPNPIEGEDVTITAIIHNIGELETNDILLNFYDGNPDGGGILIGTKTIATIPAFGTETTQINWVTTIGTHDIYVVADPLDTIKEKNEINNYASASITVIPKPDITITTDDIAFIPHSPTTGKRRLGSDLDYRIHSVLYSIIKV